MTNAKTEFLNAVENLDNLVCAVIAISEWNPAPNENVDVRAVLPVDYTEEELASFLSAIDKEYNSGYGLQELHGTIWMKDNIWFTRWEYDGSEGWEIHNYPTIPDNLKKK